MPRITRGDLLSLEDYEEQRASIRSDVVVHKKNRFLQLGPHASLQFEDQITMRYQIQEMLRVERIFDSKGIQEEIDTYNELVPSGTNWIATLFLEYPDESQRRRELERLVRIENHFYFQIGQSEPQAVHANDDMERSDETKTAAIHFLRFEFLGEQIREVQAGANVTLGIDDERLPYAVEFPRALLDQLTLDFNTN